MYLVQSDKKFDIVSSIIPGEINIKENLLALFDIQEKTKYY